ncbi:ubiquitin-protein ligase peroxin 10 NDAI_0H00840 [Naumovozyma dairenensis CBS 421]|uniref:RING-type E3 ubiquitin transferase n=1 Tax=Naumovozyma dairenensis (strain ATCC 10597 / BCRC 20456 / CBS 421 / NBRC 0211 / NRRL Y-12639) TaxID=1071378 RepID=G0WEP7_NAUDC|nr:hypothetical protein NDAI_0H00840 [Naumovozyma dairenensis CBS 421]CCD26258.1 hypothetical protein NDAI_0H00840 [Naumovozyma dairenensis CBS 421]
MSEVASVDGLTPNELKEESLVLPFADAPSIVQAHQKDEQIQSILIEKTISVLKSIKGQLFSNTHPKEIGLGVKLLYLTLTTLRGNRTLGEEYVDLIYVNRKGTKLLKRYRKLLFILSHILGSYMVFKCYRLFKKITGNDELDGNSNEDNSKFSFKNLLDLSLDTHMIVFYFQGAYYDLSKRLFGMKYALGHRVSSNEKQFRDKSSNTYTIVGYIILLQNLAKVIPKIMERLRQLNFNSASNNNEKLQISNKDRLRNDGTIIRIPKEQEVVHISLSDEKILPFIPPSSRNCILCLNDMVDPSCSPCGHIFCWRCLMDWCQERAECPLCRQPCLPQQILPLQP